MKVTIKKEIRFKDDVPPEKAAEILARLEKRFVGVEQVWKGLYKKNAAEGFLQLFPEKARQQIEDEIANLSSIKDSKRFRAEALLVLANMLLYGLAVSEFDGEFIEKFMDWHKDLSVEVDIKSDVVPEMLKP